MYFFFVVTVVVAGIEFLSISLHGEWNKRGKKKWNERNEKALRNPNGNSKLYWNCLWKCGKNERQEERVERNV